MDFTSCVNKLFAFIRLMDLRLVQFPKEIKAVSWVFINFDTCYIVVAFKLCLKTNLAYVAK